MNVLVTGAAGFIGSHLCDRFLADGHTVIGIDDLSTGSRENVSDGVNFFHTDIRNMDVWNSANGYQSFDLVVHCAASYKDPDKWHRDAVVNVLGTIDITLAAKRYGCPIVYMQTALPPVSSYAISKTAGMQYILQSGVECLIFRLANIYGPRNLSGPIPTFYKRLTEGLPCTVVDTTRDMVYIDDLVNCVSIALECELRGIYDVCSGHGTKISALYDYVDIAAGTNVGKDLTKYRTTDPTPDEAMTRLSVENRVGGWRPHTEIREGIESAVAWYQEHPPTETFTHLRVEEPTRA